MNAMTMAQSDNLVFDTIKQIRVSLQRKEEQEEETLKRKKAADLYATQWKETAYVLDRFLFVLYLVLMTVSLSLLFPKPYNE